MHLGWLGKLWWVYPWKVYVVFVLHWPMAKDEVSSYVCDLDLSFLGCLISSENYDCAQPLIFHWGVTISTDKKCGMLWFLAYDQWPVTAQVHDIAPCFWVNFSVKLVYLFTELCWHLKQWDMPVVFLLVDLHCLQMMECYLRDFTLGRLAVLSCSLIWICILLLCSWSHCSLCSQFIDLAGCSVSLQH